MYKRQPLTSTVKLSLFTHMHSSPLSLAVRLHWCHVNCSHYINNGWTFSWQTSYITPFLSLLVFVWIQQYTMPALMEFTLEDRQWSKQKTLKKQDFRDYKLCGHSKTALTGVARCHPTNWKTAGSIPGLAQAWVVDQVFPVRGVREATDRCFSHTLMFLSLFLLPL